MERDPKIKGLILYCQLCAQALYCGTEDQSKLVYYPIMIGLAETLIHLWDQDEESGVISFSGGGKKNKSIRNQHFLLSLICTSLVLKFSGLKREVGALLADWSVN